MRERKLNWRTKRLIVFPVDSPAKVGRPSGKSDPMRSVANDSFGEGKSAC
jgi:hypothetical protein